MYRAPAGTVTFSNTGAAFEGISSVFAETNLYLGLATFGIGQSSNWGSTLSYDFVEINYAITSLVAVESLVNNIYAGTLGSGLFISVNSGNSFTPYTTANGLGSNSVNSVFTLGTQVFVGTTNGLSIGQ